MASFLLLNISTIAILLLSAFLVKSSNNIDSGINLVTAEDTLLDWQSSESLYGGGESDEGDNDDEIEGGSIGRRSLFWKAMQFYISYGALAANRIPCPARSGRSYYTHNCYRARGPVHPYTRGCSAITRCRR
ncbi:protein RALF-like 34 [Impatiens glandulifera]|uniref:protein RALF-like 34 n=1 Tax=Impatiens glandulifera TaxID=253017 RepID=UPI001FB0B066|nr:protein RALF-like 34 [Impatiens glandulifera]